MDAKFVTQVNVIQQGKTAIEIYTTADRSKYTYRIMRDGARVVGGEMEQDSQGEALEDARAWLRTEFDAVLLTWMVLGLIALVIAGLIFGVVYLAGEAGLW